LKRFAASTLHRINFFNNETFRVMVDRAVPCSMLLGGEAALFLHRPAERPIHLSNAARVLI
jgi:hypothetical protein